MWNFWIDVGGTFTDCLAESPTGERFQTKVPSSGRIKGDVAEFTSADTFLSVDQAHDVQSLPAGFYDGVPIQFFNANGCPVFSSVVKTFDNAHQNEQVDSGHSRFLLDSRIEPSELASIKKFEIVPTSHAPIVAIRRLTGTPFSSELPDCHVKLGTTRGTNALLTRTGAKTAFVTTDGFKDLLLIGDQSRPELFDLTIKKPTPLFDLAIEVEERILADGTIEKVPDETEIRVQLQTLIDQNIESVAICLMHGFRFSDHEKIVGKIAREMGFSDVRMSHEVAPLIKIVPRAETTVLDAYLNLVIARYLDEIKQDLSAASRLQLMTSSGGLVSRSQFSGKDSVLSGPAGGVVGAARVAQSHGIEKVIGFDMGGTSTDVSRFDGHFERDYETVKAGVRIMTPMLAIETVAAGGGSVCWFDGAKLVVGPQSAGADPGPACYGRGGPLTVTDLNLFLGRIATAKFPFALNESIVAEKLNELCEELSQHEFEYSSEALAEGFLKIANHNMAAAIRSVSVGKGYDPKEYALVTFGGAGAQHACAVASLLNIEKIIDHPQGSILSAVGIGLAAPTTHVVRSILKPLSEFNEVQFASALSEVQNEAAKKLLAGQNQSGSEEEASAKAGSFQTRIVLNLRYVGTEPFLSIAAGESKAGIENAVSQFEVEHQRQFGYIQERDIEWVAVRAEATFETVSLSSAKAMETTRLIESDVTQAFYFGGESTSVPLFDRADVQPGDRLIGPAIIASSLLTTIVDPGWVAEMTDDRSLLMTPVAKLPTAAEEVDAAAKKLGINTDEFRADPVELEIFNQHFSSIASRMGLALQKTSVSVNVKERLDFSCAIFTATGDLVVNAPHIPVHLGAMSETVRQIILGNGIIKPNDVFVTNNPYAGGSHLPDVTVASPVFVDSSDGKVEIAFWVASRSHHSEIGGRTPGSMPPDATRLGEEGVLIDNFKLIDREGSHYDELYDILCSGPYPSRSPNENIADVQAQVAANRAGEAELLKLVRQHGSPAVLANMKFIQDAAEAKARLALKQLANGLFRFEDKLDNGATIRASIDKRQDSMTIDFTGTDPVLNDNLNANPAIVASAVMYMMRLLIDDDIPLNEGVMKPIEIVLPECFLNPATFDDPADNPAIVGGNVETSQRVVDILLGALGVAAASQGTMNNWLIGDESFGYYETVGGGSGATASGSGADAVHVHMTNTRLTDPEVFESRYPVVLREFSIRRGSGGDGEHRGGDGMVREVEFTRPLTVSLLTNRRVSQPYAVGAAKPGAAGRNLLCRKSSRRDDQEDCVFNELESRCQFAADEGDRLRLETPGGGGWSEA